MAAGLGFKTFNTGDVLTASEVNGYLMQGILVFADATARDAAITSPQEGQFAFTKDNNSLWYYSGSAWVASGATGDIEGVTAGTGISGGGTSGTVTITNSMATAIDAKGDLIVGTGADTFDRLAVGTNGHTLVADSGESTGLKWAAPAGGTKTISLIASGSLSGASLTLSSLSTYDYLQLRINGVTRGSNSSEYVRINNNSGGSNYPGTAFYQTGSTTGGWTYAATGVYFNFQSVIPTSSPANSMTIVFENCKEAGFTTWRSTSRYKNSSAADVIEQKEGVYIVAEAVSSLVLLGDGSFTAGNYELWGA